ncbi:hypothetical protein SCHPADRAFT_934601 [Schizopora paradoxa]|uniref:RNA-binding domain-containing protein n=1 Tax=Schizopora paradoxa TaxID=27342 RepID=A0A0H2S6S1_9AGAM|nr:hypothetical protein SCHPADRAFT_934601 [Schizopora paradoxa]
MAATPMAEDAPPSSSEERRNGNDIKNEDSDQNAHDVEPHSDVDFEHDAKNGSASANGGDARAVDQDIKDDYRSDAPGTDSGGNAAPPYREKQIKVLSFFPVSTIQTHSLGAHSIELLLHPNKVYIGGLPEHTRQEDLKNCFGKIGDIVNIELKLGYGFVEFETKEAAEESVAKYHEGFFMGNKIRVEISRGGSRAQKPHGEPGACFKCGNLGHWARECPNAPQTNTPPPPPRKSTHHPNHHSEHGDRSYSARDYPPKDYAPYPRDNDLNREISRYPPSRNESRYNYDYPPQAAPAPPSGREYRRPASPPREYREYAAPPPPPPRRDYDDYRSRAPAPAPPARGYYPPEIPPSYPPRGYEAPPPPRDYVDRGSERRPPTDRYAQYPPSSRARTPPLPPSRTRDEYERLPPRDYPPPDYRGRPVTPPLPASTGSRYGEYPSRGVDQRFRRRSQSPPPRPAYRSNYANDQVDPGYAPPYAAPPAQYTGNGYNGSSAPHRRERDYAHRGASDIGYSRRG